MKLAITAAVAATIGAGGAQAAVYQYDVTMERTTFNLNAVIGAGFGPAPGWAPSCEPDSTGYYVCEVGTLDVMDNSPTGDSSLERITPTVSASLILDSSVSSNGSASVSCTGSALLCDGIASRSFDGSSFASGDAFRLAAASSIGGFYLSSEGFLYNDTDGKMGQIDGDDFEAREGYSVAYETTDLAITEIAPVPLPASMPLLAVGMASLGWAARRRKA